MDAMLAIEAAIKFCDLGHSIKPWAQHERWSVWVTEEFHQLGDRERTNGTRALPDASPCPTLLIVPLCACVPSPVPPCCPGSG